MDSRMAHFRVLLKRSYPFVFESGFDLETATSDQAEDLFRQTGASGETLRRCLSFFVSAVRDCSLPISTYIKPHRGKQSTGKRGSPAEVVSTDSPPRPPFSNKSWKAVQLRKGGTLTLHLDVDLFRLQGRDRELVFNLIDRIQNFETEESTL